MKKDIVHTMVIKDVDQLDKMIADHDKDVEIRGAILKDSLCDYSYELLKGPTKGDVLKHAGVHIIHDDLQNCFEKMNVFFAHLDDAYTGNDNQTLLENMEQEVETERYYVTGFKVSGVEENRSIILTGYKEVNHGVIKFETPKIKLNGNYLYLHALKVRLFDLITEVEHYRNGKTAPQDDPDQMHIDFASEDDAFEKGKVE